MVVILPAPFGPKRLTISLGFIEKETSLTASISQYFLLKFFTSSTASIPFMASDSGY